MTNAVTPVHEFWALIDPNWGNPKIVHDTIRLTEQAAIEASIREPSVGIYSGYCRFDNRDLGASRERLGTITQLRKQGFDVKPIRVTIAQEEKA